MSQAFNTLQAAHKLEEGGFTRSQAEVIANTVQAGQGDLVTKPDLRQLGAELGKGFAELRGEISLLKWMVGITLTLTLAGLSVSISILFKLLAGGS